jgi:hypothetical protein
MLNQHPKGFRNNIIPPVRFLEAFIVIKGSIGSGGGVAL